jgi:histidine ammonia-lyase
VDLPVRDAFEAAAAVLDESVDDRPLTEDIKAAVGALETLARI